MADKTKNIKNAESPLFKRLTRLFSGPIVNYRAQTQRKFKKRQLANRSTRFNDISGQAFRKQEYDNLAGSLSVNYMAQQERAERYRDFDQMEYTPEIASALDVYADEMTTSSDLRPMMKIDCPNEEIKEVLDTLYKNILNVEFNMFGWCRTLCKYGDFFLYLDIDDTKGIINSIGLPSNEIERLEGEDPTNPNYVQFQWNQGGMTFENWQVAHFRVLGNDKYAPYGTSILEPARRIWRQLTLLEDAMMSYRIVRSPERRVFYIDVGNIPPNEVEQFVEKVQTSMKRRQVVDPNTGRVDLRYNPMSIDEDYYVPVRGSQGGTRIESLPGGTYTGDIDDVKYLRDKLFSALKVPQSYLARGDGADEDKTTLAQKDIRFARTIQRLQRIIVSEMEKVGIVHLYTLGFRGADLINFKLKLMNPSKIAELQELEHWRTKFDIAGAATEDFFSKRWIATNIFGLAEDDYLRIQHEMMHDAKVGAHREAVAEIEGEEFRALYSAGEGGEGGDDMGDDGGGGGLGGLGGDDEEGDDGDLGDLGDDEGDDEGDDSALLAAPAKRADGGRVTARSKGKVYHPEKSDSRGMGARQRSLKSHWSDETASSTSRNVFKGGNELAGLARGIYENNGDVHTNYTEEERKAQELSSDIKNLLSSLEGKKDD